MAQVLEFKKPEAHVVNQSKDKEKQLYQNFISACVKMDSMLLECKFGGVELEPQEEGFVTAFGAYFEYKFGKS